MADNRARQKSVVMTALQGTFLKSMAGERVLQTTSTTAGHPIGVPSRRFAAALLDRAQGP